MGLLNIIHRMHKRQKLSIREIARLAAPSRTLLKNIGKPICSLCWPRTAPFRPSPCCAICKAYILWLSPMIASDAPLNGESGSGGR